jgi:hypothetical protein
MDGVLNKHLVIGLGEVGKALQKVFKADGEDRFKNKVAPLKSYKFLHIAIPYNESFEEEVKKYQEKFSPKYTIIHSTVPIGTSKKLKATHSPIRGVHPHLIDSIYTFEKFVGGEDCFEVAREFKRFRLRCICTRHSKNTEALKLMSTTQYGALIMMSKEIHAWCKRNKVDFDFVYKIGNETYNEGYRKMFRHDVVRPFLNYVKGPIGGHCILPNSEILQKHSPTKLAEYILKENAEL